MKQIKWWEILLAVAVVIFITISINSEEEVTKNPNIPKIIEPEDMYEGYPLLNKDGNYAKLDEKSTLTMKTEITDELMINGYYSLFPLYASFAYAVYPEDTYGEYGSCNGKVICLSDFDATHGLDNYNPDIAFALGVDGKGISSAHERENMTLVAKEALVFHTSVENEMGNITTEQIKQIYSGDVVKWEELGIDGEYIIAYQRDGNTQTMLNQFIDGISFTSPPREEYDFHGRERVKIADYRNHKGAIGYSYRYMTHDLVNKGKMKLLSVDGIAPTDENIRSGKYPFTVEVYAATRDAKKYKAEVYEAIAEFIEWMQGEQAQQLVTKTGYVSLY